MVCERSIKLGYVVLRRQGGFKWGFELPVDNIRPFNVLETDGMLLPTLINPIIPLTFVYHIDLYKLKQDSFGSGGEIKIATFKVL